MRTAPGIELEEQVSVTNLSEVWRGRRVAGGAPVAVKFAVTRESAEQLQAEAETATQLVRSGVDAVVPAEFAAFPEAHIVFPWKGRRTFRHVIDGIRTGNDRGRACRILLNVIRAVAAVHRAGYLHGDLKPENILIDEDYGEWLIDFGMARVIRSARLESHVSNSMSGKDVAWGGTLPYLPPEGLHGESPDLSWDVYAIGVMLHEVLLGKRPDRAASPEALRSLLPFELVGLLVDCLAWSPADRIPNVPQLVARLEPFREELAYLGIARVVHRVARRCKIGLAVFFILYRHLCALALLATYIGSVLLAVAYRDPVWLVILVPFVLLHLVVRWEGPETSAEAALRRSGQVRTSG